MFKCLAVSLIHSNLRSHNTPNSKPCLWLRWFTNSALKMLFFHLNSFHVFSWSSLIAQLVLGFCPCRHSEDYSKQTCSYSKNQAQCVQLDTSCVTHTVVSLCAFVLKKDAAFSLWIRSDANSGQLQLQQLNYIYQGQTWNKLCLVMQDRLNKLHFRFEKGLNRLGYVFFFFLSLLILPFNDKKYNPTAYPCKILSLFPLVSHFKSQNFFQKVWKTICHFAVKSICFGLVLATFFSTFNKWILKQVTSK